MTVCDECGLYPQAPNNLRIKQVLQRVNNALMVESVRFMFLLTELGLLEKVQLIFLNLWDNAIVIAIIY